MELFTNDYAEKLGIFEQYHKIKNHDIDDTDVSSFENID